MKGIVKIVTAFLALIFTVDSYAQNFTNKGKEFWVGYGHHQYMETSCDGNTQGDNTQNMVLYLSNVESTTATVTVTLDGSGRAFPPLPAWSKTYTILPNQVIQTDIIPKGSVDATASGSDPNYDARLFSNFGGEELFSKRGIHIVSNTPIVAYAHIYGGVSSGATMLLPIETWGYSYTSINSEQHDADRSFSWMYVIAKDDNTRVRITPSATSRLGKPSGVPFTIDMQKGQIYQLIGQATCSNGNGVELTGSTVKSIVGADGFCHPIAVFSGSSRTGGESSACGSAGRDNDMQQCFPEVAWGKRYLTTPFSSASGSTIQGAQLQTSVFKVVIKEPGTVVKKNGVAMTGLIGGKYYKYASNTADYIESNKPVMVAQYMVGGGTSCGSSSGDPEMVYISPIEQAINNVGFFRNTKEAITANLLTLVVPTAGLPSLRINNSQIFDYTYSHPQNALAGTNYTVVVKGWAAAQSQVIVKCDSAFNAITYGLGGAESYGYNAGTYLKNLNAEGELYNKPDTSGKPRQFTCTGTPMELSALIAYQPTSITWKLSTLSAVISPSTDITVSNPVPTGTVIIGSATYYRYKVPGTYVFNTAGSFDLPFVCTSTDIDNCSLQETLQIKIEVKPRPSSSFTFTHSGCRTDSVIFNGPSNTGIYNANGWNWNFGDATIDSVKNPKKVYAATGTYNVSLVVTSIEGCLSDTTVKPITISPARAASIFASTPDGCEGTSITFSDTTTVTAGVFWWDFGVGAPVTLSSNTPQSIVYPAPGTYTVKHVIHPTGNCISDTVVKTITIYPKPVKPIATTPVIYCQNSSATPLTATALAGNTLTWYSVYPLANGSAVPLTPSTTTAGTFTFYVTQTSSQGCISDTSRIEVTITPVIAANTITAAQTVCSGSPAATLNGSTPTGGTNAYTYQWQLSNDGGATWTNIAGATSATYAPGVLSTGTTKFRRVVNSGLCSSISNVVDITVQTNLSNYEISASQTICEGTAPALLDGQTPAGGTGTYTFQWQGSTDGITWTAINGATAEDYQPGVLTTKSYFRRVTTGGNCPAISSAVIINVNPTANGNITGPAAICQYNSAAVSFTATAGTPNFTVKLLVTAPGGTTTTLTQIVSTNGPVSIAVIAANSAPGTYTIALQSISDNGGCVRTVGLNSITINVTATPALVFTPSAPAICFGNSATLNVSGAATYVWSPATGLSAATGASVVANPTTTTTYSVTGSTNGCNGTGTVTVTVNSLPSKPLAASPVSYCQNASATPLTATASAGNALTWYNNPTLTGGTATAPTPSTTTAGTVYYYVTQTNPATGCQSDTSKIEVTITPVIAGNAISANQTVCSGSPAAILTGGTLTGGTGSFTYQWQVSTNGGATWTNIAGATLATYDPGILNTGITQFRRSIISGLCSSLSNVISITVETNLSNYEISASQIVCEGVTPALLDGQTPSGGTGSYTYQWQSAAAVGGPWTAITGASTEDYQPTALTSSTYFRRITSGGNCPAISAPVLITVNPIPNGAITGPSGICSYDAASVTFAASGGVAPYTIQLLITAPGGGTSTIIRTVATDAPVLINVLPVGSAPGTYTIQLTSVGDSKNCARTTGLGSVSIVVTAKPAVTITGGSTPICEGTTTPLTANGATTYLWSPSNGLNTTSGSTVSANPVITTTYQVIGATNGCFDTTTKTITVVARPAKPIATTPVEYCLNTAATSLNATPSAGNTLTWYNAFPLTGGSATAPTPSTATAGTVYYYVTQTNNNGCVSDTSRIAVVIHPLPVVTFDLPAGICMPNGVASFKNRTTITDNSALSYAWNFGDGSPVSTATDPAHTYGAGGSYNITLTVRSAYGCTDSRMQTLSSFYEKPVASFTVNPAILCQGQNNFFIDKSDPMGSTITKWDWSFGDSKKDATNNPTHRFSLPGNYTVNLVVTTAIGCVSDTFSQDVLVYLQPKIDAGQSFVVPDGTTVQFKATANDTVGVSLYWSPPFGLSDPNILQPTLTVRQNQTYTLTAIGQGNCTAIDTLTVRILKTIEVPNAFSPNGDGTNDRWMIPNLADYPGAKVEIFNRWGQQIFLSYGYNSPWDGTYLGKPLPLATYYYIITLNNGFKPVTGSVTIIK